VGLNETPINTEILPRSEPAANRRLLTGGLVLLAVAYALQIFSPLRINTDSYRLLSMAVSASEGKGYLVDGRADQFPLGYPFMVKLLLQAGLGNSMALVVLNLLSLVVGFWAIHACCRSQWGSTTTLLALALTASSWVMVKHITLPLSDIPYLGLSLLSLFFSWLFYRQQGHQKWCSLAASGVFAYLGLQCRSIGVTIFPVIVVTVLLHRDISPSVYGVFRHRRLLLGIVVTLVILFTLALVGVRETGWYQAQFLHSGSYFQSLVASVQGLGIGAFLFKNAYYRILELGELFSNVPQSKVPQMLPIDCCIGLVAWVALLRGAWLLLRTRSVPPLTLYFLSYAALMFVWPFYDVRFWIPLLPVIAIILLRTIDDLQNRWPVLRLAFRVYAVWFFVLGGVALVVSTRMSLSGAEFSERYGDGTAKMTYRFAFHNGKPVDMNQVSETQVRLLRVFDPLARSRYGPEKNPAVGASDR